MNERGKRRLELAAGLMGIDGRASDCGSVIARIHALSPSDRLGLQRTVDWLEDYEKEERRWFA